MTVKVSILGGIFLTIKSTIKTALVNFKAGGSRVAAQTFINETRNFNVPATKAGSGQSSISDESSYLSAVNLAISDDKMWSRFRRMREYQEILEHVDYRLGQQYIEEISKIDPVWLDQISKLSDLSEIGSPPTYSFKNLGNISPTVLRYLKVSLDLRELFGDISDFSVAEVGVGFGGQAAALNILLDLHSIKLYDLPEVLSLSQKFLATATPELKVSTSDGRIPAKATSDLVISNYAFSELNGQLQRSYLENVISKSSMGYITWNDLAIKELNGLKLYELVDQIPGAKAYKEKPLTAENNAVIIWGNLPVDFLEQIPLRNTK